MIIIDGMYCGIKGLGYNNIYFDTNFLITSLKILDNIDYWGFRSNIKFF